MNYELRHNPDMLAGDDNTVLYESSEDWPVLRCVETFGSLEEAMLALAARGMSVGARFRAPPFEYGDRIYRNVSRWEVTA